MSNYSDLVVILADAHSVHQQLELYMSGGVAPQLHTPLKQARTFLDDALRHLVQAIELAKKPVHSQKITLNSKKIPALVGGVSDGQ